MPDDTNKKECYNGSGATLCSLSDPDKAFLWSLMPEWVRACPDDLDPTMYGTGSCEGDLRVRDRIITILGGDIPTPDHDSDS